VHFPTERSIDVDSEPVDGTHTTDNRRIARSLLSARPALLRCAVQRFSRLKIIGVACTLPRACSDNRCTAETAAAAGSGFKYFYVIVIS
jgi:hypothetical protein